jgi:hypothetical protein
MMFPSGVFFPTDTLAQVLQSVSFAIAGATFRLARTR